MSSKSWTPESTAQCSEFSVKTMKNCGSNPTTSTRGNSEESLERASQTTSQGFRDSYHGTGNSSCNSKGEAQSLSPRFPSLHSLMYPNETKTSSKRKSTSAEGEETQSLSPRFQSLHSLVYPNDTKTSSKRKSTSAEGEERLNKRIRGSPIPDEDKITTNSGKEEPVGANRGSSSSSQTPFNNFSDDNFSHRRDAFKAKYKEVEILGKGGFGNVFSGYRKSDNLLVAIKHIRQSDVNRIPVNLDGTIRRVPLEVVLHLKARPSELETSAVIALLDWFDLEDELILVLEKPDPCCDLAKFIKLLPSGLQEDKAKVIAQQLVDAAIDLQSRGVFHGDIKLNNILVETGADVPRARIIDFGCSTFHRETPYKMPQGNRMYTSPEWFRDGKYHAEPATVWQLGTAIWEMLHGRFFNYYDIMCGGCCFSENLSPNCRDFLQNCLHELPEHRSSLEDLKSHPWLMGPTLDSPGPQKGP